MLAMTSSRPPSQPKRPSPFGDSHRGEDGPEDDEDGDGRVAKQGEPVLLRLEEDRLVGQQVLVELVHVASLASRSRPPSGPA